MKNKVLNIYIISLSIFLSLLINLMGCPKANAEKFTSIEACKNSSGTAEDNLSVQKACEDLVKNKTTRGTLWFSKSSDISGSTIVEVDKTSSLQTIYLHGLLGYTNTASTHSYAANIELRTCIPNDFYDETDTGYKYQGAKCAPGETSKKIESGIKNLYDNTDYLVKVDHFSDTKANNQWQAYFNTGTSQYHTNTILYRGSKPSGSGPGWSTYSVPKPFQINAQTVIDTYYPGQTGEINIAVYRCYMNGGDSIRNGAIYTLGTCGYDYSTLDIKNEVIPDSFFVSSQVRGKRTIASSFSGWSSTYSDAISNGDPNTTDAWEIEFKHTLTINGADYTITQTSDCPSGYTCQFERNSNHSYSPTLASAGSETRTEKLTVTQTSTGEQATNSASYRVSKSTTQTESGHTDGTTQSGTITFTANCSPSKTGVVEIGLDNTSETIYYSLYDLSKDDYSGLPSEVQNKINEKKPNDYLNANPYPGEVTRYIQPGETKTFHYNGFYEQKITYSYKMRQDTETTTNIDENGTPHEGETINVGSAYPTNISVSGPSMGSQITCPDTTVYRPTEFYEFDNYGNGVENHLEGESHWGSDSTEVNVQATTANMSILGNTGRLYANSKTNETITLNYEYVNNYHFYPDTISSRLANLNIVWWKNGYNLPSFTPTAINNGTKEETEKVIVENTNGDPDTGSDTELTLGTHDKEICRKAQTIHSQLVHYDTTDLNDTTNGELSATTCAHLYRPWNYNLSFTSIESTSNKGMLYLNNQTTTVTAYLKNDSNSSDDPNQEGNPSYSPKTTFTLHQVTIPDSASITDVSSYIQQLKESIDAGTPLLDTKEIPGVLQKTFDPESSNNEIKFDNVSFEQAGVGNHVCLFIVANRTNSNKDTTGNTNTYYGETHPHNLYSDLTCFTVAGFPTFQVRGGSILTNGNAKAKVVTSDGEVFGSWIDYGLITNGEIKELSSGKAFIGREYKYPNNHPLTIANNEAHTPGSNDPKGKSGINPNATKDHLLAIYGSNAHITPLTSTMIDISNSINYTTFTSNQFTTTSTNPNSKYRYTKINNTSDAIITQTSQLNSGITHVIYATGNIIIGSNLTYTNASDLSQITDIPQYIIISEKSIYIDKDVSEIHAWLIANDEINTCTGYTGWQNPTGTDNVLHKQDGGGGGGYNSTTYNKDVCNKALAVYGPIFANNIWLERTSISGATGVSETVNLTAENYYWALAKAKESNKISTAYTRSLAPRY